jgi:hypothetical protein
MESLTEKDEFFWLIMALLLKEILFEEKKMAMES